MGMFLCGPVTSVSVLLGPEIFQDGDKTDLDRFNEGSGFALSSYLPRKGPDQVKSSFDTRGCGERGPAMGTDNWPKLPAWVEKRANMAMFDPKGILFRGSAHMPLFGFLGTHPRRSEDALVRREQKFCNRKGKSSLKGKGRQDSGGKSSWGKASGGKGNGKPHAAMVEWANNESWCAWWDEWEATADAPSTVVETSNGWWASPGWGAWPEGKGYAENAPWTAYSQSTNDENRWGPGLARNQ